MGQPAYIGSWPPCIESVPLVLTLVLSRLFETVLIGPLSTEEDASASWARYGLLTIREREGERERERERERVRYGLL